MAAKPDWMKYLPNNAMIGSLEIAQIYGVNKTSIPRCIDRGTIPPQSLNVKRNRGGNDAFKWLMGDVRKHLATNHAKEI